MNVKINGTNNKNDDIKNKKNKEIKKKKAII